MGASSGAEVAAELQAVLAQACAALEAQEQGRLQEAAQAFFLARSRVHYTAEALLAPLAAESPGDPDIALAVAACAQLADTYSQAIDWLTKGGSAAVHRAGTQLSEEEGTGGGSEDGTQLWGSGGVGLGELRGGAAARSGGAMPAAAQACLKEVQGSLDEVIGLTAIKQELREAVLLPMRFPQLFTGIRRPQCNLLFFGPPGTGKTMLVEKLAAEAGTPLLCLSPSAVLSKWAGESEKSIRAVFEAAAAMSPAIIFIDEVDSLAPCRSGTGDDLSSRRVLTELLIQMTAATNRPGCLVFVLAASNRPQDCDPALLRRFDRQVEVPPPDAAARAAFFAATVQRPEIASHLSDAELERLAALTEGCTGSDLSVLCRDAAMAPLRELVQSGGLVCCTAEPVLRAITATDFEAAAHKLLGGRGGSTCGSALSVLEASPARDVAAAAFAVAGSVALIKFFDTLERLGFIDKKLSRKLVHTLAGPGFLACWPLFGNAPYSRLIATVVPALNGVRLLLIGNGIVKDERAVMAMSRSGDPAELLRGPLYYVIVLMAVTSLYWRGSPVGLIVASLMCGGDGLADIVGRRFGKGNPLPWNPEKSWAGSAAMFLGGLGMSLGLITLFSSLGYFECDMPGMALTVAAISLVATGVESLPVNQSIDDNLSVPGVAAFLGIMFLQVAALAL
ncbi:hypothetical protein COHA_007657 [Chlorella ohadii]|uniref:AAA+ ATPase domain-containing protein n=1 Tax=Chlorella ohadii TaxID=2649997 RepID=A0AAD5DKF2_9CHLO|nr:hypothetical protein COHA_007657 [Chlorella ohadii]